MHRLLLAGLPPKTGSQSNDLFKVAHAIFSLVANRSKQNCQLHLFPLLAQKYTTKCTDCTELYREMQILNLEWLKSMDV